MREQRRQGLTHSLDMLGEAALTRDDADRYLAAYQQALEHLGRQRDTAGPPPASLSIKLSALHPRLEPSQPGQAQAHGLVQHGQTGGCQMAPPAGLDISYNFV